MIKRKFCIIVLSAFLWQEYGVAQRIVSGRILYKAEYIRKSDKVMLPTGLPTHSVLIFDNNIYRNESRYANDSIAAVIITNEKEQTIIQLLDFPGNKLAVSSSIKKFYKGQNYKVQALTDTKKIAGYDCYKVIITQYDSIVTEAWFTNAVVKTGKPQRAFAGIDGALMEYSVPIDDMGTVVTYTATEVISEAVNIQEFEVPKGYKKCTQKQLNKMLGARFF